MEPVMRNICLHFERRPKPVIVKDMLGRDKETWPDYASDPVRVEDADGNSHFEILVTPAEFEKREKEGLVCRTFFDAPAKNKRLVKGKYRGRHTFGTGPDAERCPKLRKERENELQPERFTNA
jgi:hypothetical protein